MICNYSNNYVQRLENYVNLLIYEACRRNIWKEKLFFGVRSFSRFTYCNVFLSFEFISFFQPFNINVRFSNNSLSVWAKFCSTEPSFRNRKWLHGTKSDEYGGYWSKSFTNSWKSTIVTTQLCKSALSWWRIFSSLNAEVVETVQ